ncbi:hypothetical protein EJD97_019535, partial [Solanum chilense]
MLGKGCKLTHVTFISVLLVCSHAGSVDKGASKLHVNVVLAEISANKLLQSDPDNYFLSSSTYATA